MNLPLQDLLMQWPLSPQYTTHPIFPDMISAMLVALVIAVGMNFAFAMLRKKTTDIEKMNRVMKETNEWRKQYTDAIKKQDKPRIEELKKKQAYVNKMALGNAATADASDVYLYDTVISHLDPCVPCNIWRNCVAIANIHSMDNV